MPYVYIHSKLTDGCIFYIGIGKDDNDGYYRAKYKLQRNKIWNRINNKHGFSYTIIYKKLSWADACEKETKLIKLLGKISDKSGVLCNITDGGEGFILKHSEETKLKISQKKKGVKWTENQKEKLRGVKKKKHTRKPRTEDHKRKIGLANKGKKKGITLSQEIKNKISISKKLSFINKK